jgi:hypothetical protein
MTPGGPDEALSHPAQPDVSGRSLVGARRTEQRTSVDLMSEPAVERPGSGPHA